MRGWLIPMLALGAWVGALSGGEGALAQPNAMVSAKDILGRPIGNDSGDLQGEIRNIMIDREQGTVRQVVVELTDPERRTVAIPWSYLSVESDGSVRLRASEEEVLRAPAFFAPGIGRGITYTPTPGSADRFDPSKVTSYRGRVVGILTAPLEGAADDVVAIIDTGSEEVRAHLGPESHLEAIGLTLVPGLSVVFVGSPSDVEGGTVVVVSRVSVGDRSFVLRNPDGSRRLR